MPEPTAATGHGHGYFGVAFVTAALQRSELNVVAIGAKMKSHAGHKSPARPGEKFAGVQIQPERQPRAGDEVVCAFPAEQIPTVVVDPIAVEAYSVPGQICA